MAALAFALAALGCVNSAARTDGGSSSGNAGAPGGNAGAPGTDAGTTTSSCAPRASARTAPPDTATPPAATGPYLWKNVAITAGGFVSGIVFNPAQRDVVYARTDIGGAYRWNAAAKRWVPLLDWVTRANNNWAGVESIAVDPQDANKVYVAAGTYVTSTNTAILRSNDQGRTFTPSAMTIPMGGNADGRSVGERLVVDANQPSTLYFGSRTMGLWKSSDGAATWARVPGFTAGPTTPNGVGIAFTVLDPQSCGPDGQTTVYAALSLAGTPIYRSSDGGQSWQPVPGQPATLLPSHGAISANGHLFVTYGGGTGNNGAGPNNVTSGTVFRLDIATGAWTDVTPSVPAGTTTFGYAGISIDGSNPDTLVVSTLDRWSIGDEIFRSTDAGATWTALDVAHAAHDVSAGPWVTFHQTRPNYTGWMADVELDPFNPARVLHVTGQGIWGADDVPVSDPTAPMHWDFRSTGIEETAVLDLTSPPAGPPLLSAVGDIGGFRHDDLDVTPADGMSQNPVLSSTDSLDFAELAPNVVARVGRITNTVAGALSTDGGATWTRFATVPPAGTGNAGSIAVSADGATLVWDVTASTRAASPAPGGPQVSHDHGATWTASTGLGAIRPVFADRVNPSKFYAFDGARGIFYASTDGGATFAATAATGLPTGANPPRPRATPGLEGDLWVVTANSLRHSTDSGASFTAVSNATALIGLGLGKAAPDKTYPALYIIGTANGLVGVHRSDDMGATWTRIDDDQHRWPTANTIIGDPRTYGRVYVGTNGRGILYGDIAAP